MIERQGAKTPSLEEEAEVILFSSPKLGVLAFVPS
jgi:hypothetical protein